MGFNSLAASQTNKLEDVSKLAHPLFIYSVIMKSFVDIIKSKSTEELLDIYNYRYLEYQESFIDLCSEN